MWVKICGVCRAGAARRIAPLEVSAIGLNRFPPSSRYVSQKRAAELTRIIHRKNPDVDVVLVHVDAPREEVQEDLETIEPDAVQFHGDESPEYLRSFRTASVKLIKAFRVGPDFDFDRPGRFDTWAWLFDAYHPEEYGGTGEKAPWEKIADFEAENRTILAGGLTPENVGEALEVVDPWGIDVCSGVEKDNGKDFNAVVRLLDQLEKTGVS